MLKDFKDTDIKLKYSQGCDNYKDLMTRHIRLASGTLKLQKIE